MMIKISLINDIFNQERVMNSHQLGQLPPTPATEIYMNLVKFFEEQCANLHKERENGEGTV